MRVELTSAAEIELDEAISYYETQRPGLGAEFASQALNATDRISEYPSAWQQLDGDDNIRRCQLNRFPYGLVYSIESGVAIILAVMHLSRQPDYWRDRAKS